ncbi:MAG: PAS domain S-box protein, partial [Desulfobacula sp.]|nr:PAS domain S-box protein [Desulfobacula sp.]
MAQNPTYENLKLRIKVLENQLMETKENNQVSNEASRNYKRFLRFLPYPVIVRDAKGLISYLNPAFSKTFGWTLIELKGKTGKQYVPNSLKNELISKIKALPANKNVLELSTKRLTKNGKVLDVMLRAGVDKDLDNNPEGMIIVLRDVTMEKRIQRNRDAMARITQLLPQYPNLRKLLFFVNTEIKGLLETESA